VDATANYRSLKGAGHADFHRKLFGDSKSHTPSGALWQNLNDFAAALNNFIPSLKSELKK
jgi:hypothetical protein